MGCGASKEAALAVHPAGERTTATATPAAAAVTAPVAIPAADSVASSPPSATTAAPAPPTSASTLKPGMLRNDRSVPSSAHPFDPTVRSDSGIGTRHSAGSTKSTGAATSTPLTKLPSIPKSAGSVVASNGSGAAVDGATKPTAFEIPLDENVKVRARKPMSANPRNRRRTQLQPMVHLSNEDVQKRLKEAEAKWDEDSNPAKDKDLDPAVLRALVADREHRIAMNRLRELEEKKTKLLQHDAHARAVAERKLRLVAQQQSPSKSLVALAGAGDEDEIPVLRMSWGGENGLAPAAGSARSVTGGRTAAITLGFDG